MDLKRVRYIPAGNYNLEIPDSLIVVNTNKLYLDCLTSQGPIVISFPKISTTSPFVQAWGFHIYIADSERNASVNNITLVAAPGDIIYGGAAVVINMNGGVAEAFIAGKTTWGCLLGPTPGSSGGGIIQSHYFNTINGQNSYVFDGTVTSWNPTGIDLRTKPIAFFTSSQLVMTPTAQYTWTPGTATLHINGTVYPNVPSGLYYQS